MGIPKEIKQSRQKLSGFHDDFLDFVEKNPGMLARANFKSLELTGDIANLQPWPTFIGPKRKEKFERAAVQLFRLIKQVPRRVFNNDPGKIKDYYNIPLNLAKLQLEGITTGHMDNLLSRCDFILSASGLKCLEYNVSANLGGLQIPTWESLYLKTPLISTFLQEYAVNIRNKNIISLLLEHVIQPALPAVPGAETGINTAFVAGNSAHWDRITLEAYLNRLYKEVLSRAGRLKGCVSLCDYPDLEVVGDSLIYQGNRIHVLIEMYNGLVSPPVLKAFKTGNIFLYNGPVTTLLSNKLNLALLSDYRSTGVFTGEEQALIDAHVPWTRKIGPGSTYYGTRRVDDLEQFIRSHRELLVIKPSIGLGGQGVYVGKSISRSRWDMLVSTALRQKNWVVQEWVESSSGVYQCGPQGYDLCRLVWGFYLFGSRYAGTLVRILPQKKQEGVVNVHQGAEISVVFEVEE